MLYTDLCSVKLFSKERKKKKTKKKKRIELLITFQMETTIDFNSHICSMDGLKSECLENTIAFVVFLFDI